MNSSAFIAAVTLRSGCGVHMRKTFCWLISLSICSVSLAAGNDKAPTPTTFSKPNIIVLLADDLGYGDLSSYGHPSIRTPQLDRLANEGQRWTDFYVAAPVCSPSRGALITGKYPTRSGLYGRKNIVAWPGSNTQIPDDEITLPEVMKRAGYETAMFGKWHLGDRPPALPTRHGFDRWVGLPYSNDMDHPEFDWRAAKSSDFKSRLDEFLRLSADPDSRHWNATLYSSKKVGQDYQDAIVEKPVDLSMLTRRYTKEAVSYIKQRSADHKPFFMYVAYTMPHTPVYPGADFSGKSLRGKYGDAVEEIDWSVGQIRATLDAAGLSRNTLIVFSSDNGPDSGSKNNNGSAGLLRGRKGTIYEGGMRVPGIFWWPGKIKPGMVSGIGTLMDVYAVSVSLSGMEADASKKDAVDLGPALFAGQASPRTELLYHSPSGEILAYRHGRYKILMTQDGGTRSEGSIPPLYDLQEDPSEAWDLSSKEKAVADRMMKEMQTRKAGIETKEPLFDR